MTVINIETWIKVDNQCWLHHYGFFSYQASSTVMYDKASERDTIPLETLRLNRTTVISCFF